MVRMVVVVAVVAVGTRRGEVEEAGVAKLRGAKATQRMTPKLMTSTTNLMTRSHMENHMTPKHMTISRTVNHTANLMMQNPTKSRTIRDMTRGMTRGMTKGMTSPTTPNLLLMLVAATFQRMPDVPMTTPASGGGPHQQVVATSVTNERPSPRLLRTATRHHRTRRASHAQLSLQVWLVCVWTVAILSAPSVRLAVLKA